MYWMWSISTDWNGHFRGHTPDLVRHPLGSGCIQSSCPPWCNQYHAAGMWCSCSKAVATITVPTCSFAIVDCWQVYKSALPSHTVYTLNMERILNRMTHPSHEELEHDEIHRQEMNLKQELDNRQRLLCAETSITMWLISCTASGIELTALCVAVTISMLSQYSTVIFSSPFSCIGMQEPHHCVTSFWLSLVMHWA